MIIITVVMIPIMLTIRIMPINNANNDDDKVSYIYSCYLEYCLPFSAMDISECQPQPRKKA